MPIPVICGPTGSGKSSVAMNVAEKLPLEIISADSRQLIKHLNIGTAKPTSEQQASVTTHLIDLVELGERYSAYRFIDDADQVIGSVLARGKLPLVVGGTGLYLKALTDGVVRIDDEADPEVRNKLLEEMEKYGPERMHQRLAELDPTEAAKVAPANKVRVIRALEIFELTGKSKTDLLANGAYKKSRYQFKMFCLMSPRSQLYAAIDMRVDQMLAGGLLTELEQLIEKGYRQRIARANVIGYSELLDHLEGRLNLTEAVGAIKQNTRRFAKRQITWFRHQISAVTFENGHDLARELISFYKNGDWGQKT